MKRQRLLQHLQQHGCIVLREKDGHTKVYNPANGRRSTVPRHREINAFLARTICDQRGVPAPRER